MFDILTRLAFASDAAILALAGIASWIAALVCLAMERRRVKRRSLETLERVGWVPWTPLFLALTVIGGGCLAVSLPVVLGSL
ncbi:hypothetical protein [Erythrobacter sp.]|jgi:hypothetical protein|uniref:hypothetical protein n=1 Tax=Erythrobacter sp. TaxID=1042 RepID=UPI002EC6CE0A|nr:hypothetical protein [Erythrobacter sp.]